MEGSLPVWGQQLAVLATTIIGVIIGIYKYIKTESGKSADKPASSGDVSPVIAASFLDSRVLKELIDTIREAGEEFGRDSKRTVRAVNELREAVVEHTEAVRVQTDATLNLLRFINRQHYGTDTSRIQNNGQ